MTTVPRVLGWDEFTKLEPELARFGVGRLTAAPAYLATIRRTGAPRVHPVTPIFFDDRLFLFMEPTSPKRRDLLDRGLFALHSGVPDNAPCCCQGDKGREPPVLRNWRLLIGTSSIFIAS